MKLTGALLTTGLLALAAVAGTITLLVLQRQCYIKSSAVVANPPAMLSAADILHVLCSLTSSACAPNLSLPSLRRHPDVPPLIWTFWFSSRRQLGPLRRQGAETMASRFGVPVVLLDERSIAPFLQWPVHPALRYVSALHKADYYRIYFCLHYGGGYADLKLYSEQTQSWVPFFQQLESAPHAYVLGVPEIGEYGVASPPNRSLGQYYYRLISNGFFISRRNNAYFAEVHRRQNAYLSSVAEALEQHPAPHDRCCRDHEAGYPIDWSGLLGQIMSVVGVEMESWEERILRRLAYPPYGAYQDDSLENRKPKRFASLQALPSGG